jgi:signal transduction histidine kinase
MAADQFESSVARRGGPPLDVVVRVVADGAGDSRAATFRWVLRDVTELRLAEADRDRLLRRVVTAHEDERRRVSREMHDTFGQLLTALSLSVKAARDVTPLPTLAATRLIEVQHLTDELSRAAHDLAVRLRPTALDDVGLFSALGQYVAQWSARTGVEVDYEAAAVEADRLPVAVETAIYRIVQEALTNVARHAKARRVSVVISRHDDHATVAVEDDGVGFDPAAVAACGRLGLVGMRERAALAAGTLEVESTPGEGTTVLARFPLSNGGGGARPMAR